MSLSRTKWLMTALAAAVVFFVVVGFLSLGGYFLLSKRRSVQPVAAPSQWVEPLALLQPESVSPATGLLRLGGVDDVAAINTALRSGHAESAYSLISTGTRLADEERIGSLLLVGKRYAADGNGEKARAAYRQIAAIATLSPTLSDFARADAFLQVGEELSRLNQPSEAIHALNQARTVGLYSIFLKPAHRKHILDRLVPAYSDLGLGRGAWEDLEVALQPGGGAQATSNEPAEPLLLQPTRQEADLPGVLPAQTERQQKATALAEYVRDRGGKVSDTLVEDLGQALTVEDALRQGEYSGIAEATQPADRIALLESRVNWLAVKHSVAHLAQGASLVPAWEQQAGSIESELAKAWQELYAAYADQIVALPDPASVDRAWVELYRHELLMGRLGLYPNYPEQQLDSKLREATIRLMSAGRDRALRVDSLPGESPLFFLADGPDYGKGYLPQ